MKKLATLVTTVLLAVMAIVVPAGAVEFIESETASSQQQADIIVELPLATNGRICGLREMSEQHEGIIALDAKAPSKLSGINTDGSVLRHKAVKAITVADESISDGMTKVGFARFVPIEDGTKQTVISETIVAIQQKDGSWAAFCRMTVLGQGTPVAKFYLANGQAILVVKYDWDSDGQLEYCLVAGSNGSNGQQKPNQAPANPTPTTAPEKPAPQKPTTTPTPAPETGRPPVKGSENSYNDVPADFVVSGETTSKPTPAPQTGREPVKGSQNSFSDLPEGF